MSQVAQWDSVGPNNDDAGAPAPARRRSVVEQFYSQVESDADAGARRAPRQNQHTGGRRAARRSASTEATSGDVYKTRDSDGVSSEAAWSAAPGHVSGAGPPTTTAVTSPSYSHGHRDDDDDTGAGDGIGDSDAALNLPRIPSVLVSELAGTQGRRRVDDVPGMDPTPDDEEAKAGFKTDQAKHVRPENFFRARDLTYQPRSVARMLRTAAWTCVALLFFAVVVVGASLFIVHNIYGLGYSFSSGTLSMASAVAVSSAGRVGLHTTEPLEAVEIAPIEGGSNSIVRLSSPAFTGSTGVQRMELGRYLVTDDFEATASIETVSTAGLTVVSASNIQFTPGRNASVSFTTSGSEDDGSVVVAPYRAAKLSVDGSVVFVSGSNQVSLSASSSARELVSSHLVEAPALRVTGATSLGSSASDQVVVAGTLNVSGAIDLRRGTLLLENTVGSNPQTISNINVGVLNVSALNFEEKHLTLLTSLDAGNVRVQGTSLVSSVSDALTLAKPLGGGTTVTATSVGTFGITTTADEDALRFLRDGDSGFTKLSVSSTTSEATIALPNTNGTVVVAASAPHLSIATTGVLSFDQSQVTGTGALVSGSIGTGFGSISTASSISTTGVYHS